MEGILAALYDDRSIRAHVHRTRELLSLSTLHASLSTSLAFQYETSQSKASSSGGLECYVTHLFSNIFYTVTHLSFWNLL